MSEPVTREEQLLSAIVGGGDILSPITRQEMYLAYLAGDTSISLPEPVTRKEQFLYQACLNGGGGGGSISLQDKTITENGEYTADAGYDGLGKVTVDVAGSGGSDEDWIIGDGNTHIWITLTEGRTSPMLGVCPNGTVTVDWGDGSTPDVLTGTSTSTVQWTPNHEYEAAGDYVITLTVDGEMGILGSAYGCYLLAATTTRTDVQNAAYRNAIRKIEVGNGVTSIGDYAFLNCYSLTNAVISNNVTSIGPSAFKACYRLTNIVIPDSVTSIGNDAFRSCSSLTNAVIPNSVTSIGNSVFNDCWSLASGVIPDSVTSAGENVFANCFALTSVVISNSLTNINHSMFSVCKSLASAVIPNSITSIGVFVFANCSSLAYVDFSTHTAVPTLSATSAFNSIPADCEIRVPAALVDEWKAATNWSTYADEIVGV